MLICQPKSHILNLPVSVDKKQNLVPEELLILPSQKVNSLKVNYIELCLRCFCCIPVEGETVTYVTSNLSGGSVSLFVRNAWTV